MKDHPLRRTTLTIRSNQPTLRSKREVVPVLTDKQTTPSVNCCEASVLVVNASREMATQMTMELTARLPGCSIMYAPSIDLAKLIVARRRIDLVVSSPVLPDGGVRRLREALDKLSPPPDLVVVGEKSTLLPLVGGVSQYHLATARSLGSNEATTQEELQFENPPLRIQDTVRSLGADLRNDLNNPLQAIVAMVFVAKAASGASATTLEALEAIDDAAKNMAHVVKGIETKILGAVSPVDASPEVRLPTMVKLKR